MAASSGIHYSQEKSSEDYLEAIKREGNVLGKIRKEIVENENKLKELSKQEKDVLSEIYHIERKIDLTDNLIAELEKDIDTKQKELAELEYKIENLHGELAQKQDTFYMRLRGLYKRRNVQPLELVFSSSSFTAAFKRIYFLTLIAGEDKRQIAEYVNLSEELTGIREERRVKLSEIAGRIGEVKREKSTLLETDRKRENLHASVRKQKAEREKAIERLKQETKRLSSLIDNLEKQRLMAVERERRGLYDLDKAIGMLQWPVEGNIIRGFGNRYNPDLKIEIESNGIDIKAEKGTAVLAVAPGRVEFSDWWQSYGKMIIISHSNGYYSLYSHLSRVLISVGKDVKEGDVIGEVGDTGSLSGPCLHFEIRKGREAVDPITYLRKK